jgi:hypothetical protein
VEPQAPLRGDVGDPREVVDEPAVRGAAGGDDGEDVVRVLGVVERTVERFTGETPFSSVGTTTIRGPSRGRLLRRTNARRRSRPPLSARARRAVSPDILATTSALRLAAVPPVTNTPPAPDGKAARSASQRRASFSANTAPAPSSHDPP